MQTLRLDQSIVDAVGLARWPFVFALVALAAGMLYKLAPAVSVPFRWCLAAGALFSLGWLAATAIFAFYVANFANYSNTYGALGGVIILMLWFYLTAFVLVASAALMAAALKESRPEQIEPQESGRCHLGGPRSGACSSPHRSRDRGGARPAREPALATRDAASSAAEAAPPETGRSRRACRVRRGVACWSPPWSKGHSAARAEPAHAHTENARTRAWPHFAIDT